MRQTDAIAAWRQIAERYLAVVDSAAHNALYERPAMLNLIGDISGIDVLDIGSGSGFYAAELLHRGAASVAALDATPAMVEATRLRTGGRADVRHSDLRGPMPFRQQTFDLIVASLTLHYLEDWVTLLSESRRVLRPGGRFIMSTGHPISDFEISVTGNYFELESIIEEWSGLKAMMPIYRRPLSMIIRQFFEAGFALQYLHEPTPIAEMRKSYPKAFGELSRKPAFICLSFVLIK